MSTIDYTASRDFAERFNAVSSDGKKLSETFFYKEYNIWYCFQAAIFNDAKIFYKTGDTPKQQPLSWKGHAVSILLLFFSMVSFCFRLIIRKEVLFFSVDTSSSKYKGDFRMRALYRLLHAHSISFFECFHTVPNIKTLKHILFRKRAALYLESIDYLYYLSQIFERKRKFQSIISGTNLDGFPLEEKAYAEFLVHKYIQTVPHVVFRIRMWKIILRLLGVKLIMSIDDVRNYNELMVASTMLGVPSFAFQHGHYSKYHRGFLDYGFSGKTPIPTKLFVWNEYWKRELNRLHSIIPQNHVVVSGTTSTLSTPVILATNGESKPISILIPFETDAPKAEVSRYIEKILTDSDFHIVFKVRPDIDALAQAEEYGLLNPHPRVEIVKNVSDAVSDVTIVGGVYSTFLYDMIAMKKPVFLFDTSMDYGEGLVLNLLAEKLPLDALIEGIQKIAQTPQDVLDRRFDTLEGANPKNFETTISEYLKTYEII